LQIATFAFLNSGQICLCIKRIFVHKSIYRPFVDAMARHAKTFQVGDGFAADTFCGPIQNSMQYERVKGFFSEIEKEKWNVACGGQIEKTNGYFITPTIIDNPPEDARIVTEEPFGEFPILKFGTEADSGIGPIVPTLSWDAEEEVIERANATNMGLGASVWSKDTAKADHIARQLEAGTVWVNNHFDLSPMAPFGGFKESGLGVEMGTCGLKAMCNSQTLMINKKA